MAHAKEVVAEIAKGVAEVGGVHEWADAQGVANANVYATLSGRLKPGGQIAAAVGYRRVTVETYVPLDAAFTPPDGFVLVPERPTYGRGHKKALPEKPPVRDFIWIKNEQVRR